MEAMELQDRNSENARRNDDGRGALTANQCIPTGIDCYIGDICCESGEVCPSCTVAPCTCLPVARNGNKKNGNKKAGRNRNSVNGNSDTKKFANRGGSTNRNGNKNGSQCVDEGSDCFIGDICCNSGETCPSCNVAPCKC